MSLNLEAYDYYLPAHLIAHEPLANRTDSKLLRYRFQSGQHTHHSFKAITQFLKPSDVLVFNDSKVIKARLSATRSTGGAISILLLRPSEEPEAWWALAKPVKRIKAGEILSVQGEAELEVLDKNEVGEIKLRALRGFERLLDEKGVVPLPPYLNHSEKSANQWADRYQSVFAKHEGAIAAPTASLHFDEHLLATLKASGIQFEYLTLHVGYGTFQPLQQSHFDTQKLHQERLVLDSAVAQRLTAYKNAGRRLIAVGTTVVRSLEASWADAGFDASIASTDLFIQPGYRFKAVDGMLTNFHLPKSSLMMLVAALIGRESLMELYQEAVQQDYRFFSFGDAMLLLPD